MSTITGNPLDTGFWSRFRGLFSSPIALDKGETAYPFAGGSTLSGASVTTETSLKLSTVLACVRLRSEVIGSLPFHLMDANKHVVTDHPLYRLLHSQPNYDMSAFEYFVAQISSMDLHGGAYSLIHRDGKGEVVALEPLDASAMSQKRLENGVIQYEYRKKNQLKTYSEDEILHFRGFSLDGLKGLSVIQYGADTLGFQMDANNVAQNQFRGGLKAGGFLKTGERTLNDDQRKRLRESMETFSRPENAGKMMVLEAGMDVAGTPIKINPVDAQLLESRRFGIEEICRMFGVPPQLIGHTDKASSWASSLEQMNLGFLTYTLQPIIIKMEQTIARKLLSPADRLKYTPKFSVNALLRADVGARAQFYAQVLQNGVMTRNEARDLEDMPRMDGADALTVQLNMTTVDQIGAIQDEPNKKPANPV